MSVFAARLLGLVEQLTDIYCLRHGSLPLARPGQALLVHLIAVAEAAAARVPEALKDLAFAAGLLHDLGKYNPAFQRALLLSIETGRRGKAPIHSIVGTLIAEHNAVLRAAIYAHHSGLRDWFDNPAEIGLRARLREDAGAKLLHASVPADIALKIRQEIATLALPDGMTLDFAVRMVSSALIDADRTNAAGKSLLEPIDWGTIEAEAHTIYDRLFAGSIHYKDAAQRTRMTSLDNVRRRLLGNALLAAEGPKGLYSMTAPLGSGKTIAAILFAVRHARCHNLSRVVIVSPMQALTSEIALTVRTLLPKCRLLEDHSSVPFERLRNDLDETPEEVRITRHSWSGVDVIITTSVQMAESLYTHLPSKSRKVHRLSNSVIILDEAHLSLPMRYLRVLGRDLRQLVDHCGSTVVLMSATQMDLSPKPRLRFDGLSTIEINQHVEESFAETVRVTPHVYGDLKQPLNLFDDQAAATFAVQLSKHPSVLCIVNEVAQAEKLHQHMPEGTFLMTGHMCPKHRSDVLAEVKQRQKDGKAVRLIATSLVEVGVNIDFPVVFRALTQLGSIIQSMGRCNRNWTIERGDFFIFSTVDRSRDGDLGGAKQLTLETIREMPDLGALLHPDALRNYTSTLMNRGDAKKVDAHGVIDLLKQKAYRTASREVRVIDGETVSVLVAYDDTSRKMIAALENGGRLSWGDAQPYLVSLHGSVEKVADERKFVKKWHIDKVVIDQNPSVFYRDAYHPTRGLVAPHEFSNIPHPVDVEVRVLSHAGDGC